MTAVLIGSRSICSWWTTVHRVTLQRVSMPWLLFFQGGLGRKVTYPATSSNLWKTAKELILIFLAALVFPLGHSPFSTPWSPSAVPQPLPTCPVLPRTLQLGSVSYWSPCVLWHRDLKAKCRSPTRTLRHLVGHFSLPSFYIPISQNIVHDAFNGKSPGFSYNSLPHQLPPLPMYKLGKE